MANAAAQDAGRIMREAIARRGRARIIVATGNSQIDLITFLTQKETIDWKLVEIFHMDEYADMSSSHPASFVHWIRTRVTNVVHPGKVHYIRGDSPDLEKEIKYYGALLNSETIDLCLLGIGENGHIAFNDPHAANFKDPLPVKRVVLDAQC